MGHLLTVNISLASLGCDSSSGVDYLYSIPIILYVKMIHKSYKLAKFVPTPIQLGCVCAEVELG